MGQRAVEVAASPQPYPCLRMWSFLILLVTVVHQIKLFCVTAVSKASDLKVP